MSLLRIENETKLASRGSGKGRMTINENKCRIMDCNLPADTTDFSSLRKFCASVTKDYLLTVGTVYFM